MPRFCMVLGVSAFAKGKFAEYVLLKSVQVMLSNWNQLWGVFKLAGGKIWARLITRRGRICWLDGKREGLAPVVDWRGRIS